MANEQEVKAAEEKAVADKAAEEAEAERLAGLSEEEKKAEAEKKELDKGFDYEAELKAERERGKQDGLAEAAFKNRDKKRIEKDAGDDEDEDLDKPLTGRQLQEVLAAERQKTQKELQFTQISEQAGKLASSESERSLIIEIHKNRLFPEGMPLSEQLEEAYAIANKKRFPALLSEAKRALRSKETVSDVAAGTHRDAPVSSEPKISSADATAIKSAGFTWDGSKRMWKKALKDGKFLYKDPKSGKVFKQ